MTSRERFEKWAESNGWNIDRTDEGDYRTRDTNVAWSGWYALERCIATCFTEQAYREFLSDPEHFLRVAMLEASRSYMAKDAGKD